MSDYFNHKIAKKKGIKFNKQKRDISEPDFLAKVEFTPGPGDYNLPSKYDKLAEFKKLSMMRKSM